MAHGEHLFEVGVVEEDLPEKKLTMAVVTFLKPPHALRPWGLERRDRSRRFFAVSEEVEMTTSHPGDGHVAVSV